MTKTVVFFRCDCTGKLMKTACAIGLLRNKDSVMIVAKNMDPLFVEGDTLVKNYKTPEGYVVLVTNGGAITQLAPVLAGVVKHAEHYLVVDLQEDYASPILEGKNVFPLG